MDILIPLTPVKKGRFAIIGIEDADLASGKWFLGNFDKYARCSDGTKVLMHRVIFERVIGRPLEKYEFIDHIDGNGLNNKRYNLRLATSLQNHLNKAGRGTSRFRGVSFNKKSDKWAVQIHFDDKSTYLGKYDSEITAAQVYDAAAREYLDSEFVKFNFPDQAFYLSDFDIVKNQKTGRPQIELPKSQTGYRGVEFHPTTGKYGAKITFNHKNIRQGLYDTPEEAARAYDAAAGYYLGERAILNFPNETNIYDPKRFLLQSHNTSGYRGVTKRNPYNKWRASIKVNKKSFHLGDFDSPIDAAIAYDKAALGYLGQRARLNFPSLYLSPSETDSP